MAITSIGRYFVGNPNIVGIVTTDDFATITTSGYVFDQKENIELINNGEFQWTDTDIVLIHYSPSEVGFFTYNSVNQSFEQDINGGGADLPTVEDRIAHFSNDDGTVSSAPSDVTNIGDITAGEMGTKGYFVSYSTSPTGGRLRMAGFGTSSGDYAVTVRNSDVTQDQIIAIPDAETGNASFLIDAGPSSVKPYEILLPLSNFQAVNSSNWVYERIVAGEYSLLKTSNSLDTYAIDLTHQISLAADRGFRLNGFDVIFGISTANLVSHTVNLYHTIYLDNIIPSIVNIGISTNTLPIADRPNIYAYPIDVTSPLFNNDTRSKYVLEIAVNNTGSPIYRYFGVNLKFSQTIP